MTTTAVVPRWQADEDQAHHGLAVGRVERARRLVGQQQAALAHDGSRDGDPLALAAGELVGVVLGAIAQPELFEGSGGGCLRLSGRYPVELHGQ